MACSSGQQRSLPLQRSRVHFPVSALSFFVIATASHGFVQSVKKSVPQRRQERRRKREGLAGESGMNADKGWFALKAINECPSFLSGKRNSVTDVFSLYTWCVRDYLLSRREQTIRLKLRNHNLKVRDLNRGPFSLQSPTLQSELSDLGYTSNCGKEITTFLLSD